MGFFDNVLKKVGATLATRYGVVSSGKYKGCDIVLGNPPTQKISTSYSFSQMIFLADKEEVARLDISSDIADIKFSETFTYTATGHDGYRCIITFRDGDTCQADLSPSRIQVFYSSVKSVMSEETQEFFEEEIKKLS